MGICERLQHCLDEADVSFETIHHARDYHAKQTAEDTHTPGSEFAKTIFVEVDGRFAMAVLPATHHVSPGRLATALGADVVRVVGESETEDLCPDCEVGAAPPFGHLWDLPVYVSPALARDETITFNAGSHDTAVRMGYQDFEALVKPRVVHMARHEGDDV